MRFNPSPIASIGIEVELQLLDPKTRNLTSVCDEILTKFPETESYFKQELIQSTLEVITGVSQNIEEAEKDLSVKFAKLFEISDKLGFKTAVAGSHPFAHWSEQTISDHPRYHALVDRMQWAARRLMIFGLHVHIGIPSGEKAIAISNALTTFIPHFLALSSSSPFWDSEVTGLASVRSKVFESLPTAGLPYRLINWGDFQRFINTLETAQAIQSIREVWWDIRPHPAFGTLEIRVCDGLPTLKEVLSMAAFIQALVVWLGRRYDMGINLPVLKHWIIRENKWRAARFGLDTDIIISDEGKLQNLTESIYELVGELLHVSKDLESEKYLMGILDILKIGPSYKRQLKVYETTGSYEKVVDSLINEMRTNQMGVGP
ncbi:MAG: glutamate--cysteine ligase [Calditrichaeota bacterium]|nr:MAG: glutamate--cysteine ligase [Calditrichota bacterium]